MSASDYNRLKDIVRQMVKAAMAHSANDAAGLSIRALNEPLSPQLIRVKNTTSSDLPAFSFVELTDYDSENGLYEGRIPSTAAIEFAKLAITLEKIEAISGSAVDWGYAAIGGVRQLAGENGDDFSFGDYVGAQADSGKAIIEDGGPYMVMDCVEDGELRTLFVRGRGGAGGRTFARITQAITRGDPTTQEEEEPVPAETQYKIAIIGGPETPTWSPAEVYYTVGTIVKYTGEDEVERFYECQSNHTSNDVKAPDIATDLWTETAEGIEAYLEGVPFDYEEYQRSGNYRQKTHEYVPWFSVGDVVQAYNRPLYDHSTWVASDISKWFICGPFMRVEHPESSGGVKYSLRWSEEDKRTMAVFG